ncbi:hypothetical protein MMC09_002151 [Bachmanniomyces sp. S44760]|nr:hypothetical protein [Bachmanniomyces sp. S44760]
MAASKPFLDAVKDRRTLYKLAKESTISDARIEELVEQAILHVPSSFNSQSTRLVVLLKKDHEKVWDFTRESLAAVLPEEQKEHSLGRLDGFHAAYGTILFFEDPAPIKKLQSQMPAYADKFLAWSDHTSAMHQYMLWTALEAEGLGCNLQHYNPLADAKIQSEWNINPEWSLKAQLVFGKPEGGPAEKTFEPVEKRVFVYGK